VRNTLSLQAKTESMLRIKELCKEKGITFSQMAKELNVSASAISQMASGNPNVSTLLKIADVLGCNITELFEPTPNDAIICPICGTKFAIM